MGPPPPTAPEARPLADGPSTVRPATRTSLVLLVASNVNFADGGNAASITLDPVVTSQSAVGAPRSCTRPDRVRTVRRPDRPSSSMALEPVSTSADPAPPNDARTDPLCVLASSAPVNP